VTNIITVITKYLPRGWDNFIWWYYYNEINLKYLLNLNNLGIWFLIFSFGLIALQFLYDIP